MADFHALATLIRLARQQTDDAARDLGEAVRVADAARQKLALLLQYRDEYANRFQRDLSRSLHTGDYRNYRSFLEKLETAASGQRQVLRDAEQRVEAQRNTWQAAARRRDSFETLADRMKTQEARREGRREQRLMDEHATRSAVARRRT